MSIHQRIKDRRIALGLSSHKALAALVGVSWQTVQLWEKEGGTAPNRSRMPAVVATLKTTQEWLLYGTGIEVVSDQEEPQRPKGSSPPVPPKWMDPEAYRLLELYYSLNERKRGNVLRYVEGLQSEVNATASGGKV